MRKPLSTLRVSRFSFFGSLRSILSISLILSLMILSLQGSLFGQCQAIPETIRGEVFNDFNYNGLFEAEEDVWTGFTVQLYNSNNVLVQSAVTDDSGRYAFAGLNDGEGYRLVLQIPEHLKSTLSGPDHEGLVRIVEAPACGVRFGASDPTAFCDSENPFVAVTCFVQGAPGTNDAMETVVLTPYLFDDNSPIDKIAMKGQTGSVFGTAWSSASQTLYTSAFVKQDAFLKDGLGAIYRSYRQNGMYVTELWQDVSALGIDFGPLSVSDADDCDYGAQVGKVGIGGIEISADESKLYLVNLYNKSIVSVDLNNPSPATTTEIALPMTACTGGEMRPFAIKNYEGKLYVSATCDASISQRSRDHSIYIYSLDLSTMMFEEEFSTSYTREHWLDYPADNDEVAHWLTDLEFTNDGYMLLGIADRQSHRYCHSRLNLQNQYPDLLMVWNDNGEWKLEHNGIAGPLVGSGVGNGQGPGGGEFFGEEHWILGPLYHPEIATGSIFVLPGSDEVASTVFDPKYSTFSGGLHRYSTKDGSKTGVIELYTNDAQQTFGKGSGLGNVIDMCGPAPIQIGNLVWLDENMNGIQDANESGASGLEMSLIDESCNVVATATTDSEGRYYFRSGIDYHSSYYVVVSDPSFDHSSGTVNIDGDMYHLTLSDAAMTGIADMVDSDAHITTGLGCDLVDGKIAVPVQIAGPGHVDHSFDIGLSSQPVIVKNDTFDLALMKAALTTSPVKSGEIVEFEITIFNQGNVTATEIELVDYLPQGLEFSGILNPGWFENNGLPTYFYNGLLQPGESAVVTISLQVVPTNDPLGFVNYAEIASAKDEQGNLRSDIDSSPDRTNGNDIGGEPDGLTDNEYDDDGTVDEDDHDPALVKTFDLALIKTVASDQTVRVGDEILFTMTVVNQGQIAASNIALIDYLPAGLALSSNDANGWSQVGPNLVKTLNGVVGPGAMMTTDVLLEVTTAAGLGQLTNVAEITSATNAAGTDMSAFDFDSDPDSDPLNDAGGVADSPTDNMLTGTGILDEDDHDAAIVRLFDLALRKEVEPSFISTPDQDLNYTISVENQGDVAAKNIRVHDHLPQGLVFDPAKNPFWFEESPGVIRALVTSVLRPGESLSLPLILNVDQGALGQSLVNVAEISAANMRNGEVARDFDSDPDTDKDNDSPSEDDRDEAEVSSAAAAMVDIALEKTVAQRATQAGEDVHFDLTVSNDEEAAVGLIRIVDYLPFFLENIDPNWQVGGGGLYIYRDLVAGDELPVDGLKRGETATVGLETRVLNGVPPGMIINLAEVARVEDLNGLVLLNDPDSQPDADPLNDRSANPIEVAGGAGVGQRPIEDDRGATEIVISTVERRNQCTCLNNETNETDGQFTETLVVISASGENWFVQEANQFFSSSSPNPPAAPVSIEGESLVESVIGGGLSSYSINGVFTQGTAWYAVLRNNFDALLSIDGGQECLYTRPALIGVTSPCVGGLERYEVVDPVPGATYSWSLSGGGTLVGIPTGPRADVQWDNAVGGPYTLTVNEVSPDICTAPYSLNIEVGDQFVYSVACIMENQISLGNQCETVVTPQMLLAGGPYDYSAFSVMLEDEHGHPIPNATLTFEHIGKRIMAKVINACTGNSCWAWLTVEDKLAPEIICFNDTVSCTSMGQYPLPVAIDACDPDPEVLLLDETVEAIDCDRRFIKRVTRTYIAQDMWGNQSDVCTQEIMLTRIDIEGIDYPDTFSIAKGNALMCNSFPADSFGRPLPEYTGIPMYGDVVLWPEDFYCSIAVDYRDIELPQVGCVRKMIREWRILEWYCTSGFNLITYPQYIEITDQEAPEVTCPQVDWVITNTRSCDADVAIELPNIEDICADSFRVDLVYPGGFIEDFRGGTITLPVDTNLLKFRVYDPCYNVDSCEFEVVVADNTPPVAICDQFTTVGLTDTGRAYIYAHTFDDGSYDNCVLKTMEVKRMDDGRNCGLQADTFGPYVDFCCEDVGENVMVMFRVTDKSGNTNTCMIEVEVQDKIPPMIYCPPNDTINCEYHYDTSDLSQFGEPVVFDNCDYILTEQVYENVDQCREGYIERVFVARDHNNVTTCVQRIYIINDTPFHEGNITWPEDLDTTECREGLLTPDLLPERHAYPIVDEDACDLVGVTYTDQTFQFVDNTEACYKIIRRWKVVNWCRFDTSVYDTWIHEQVIKVNNAIAPTITSDLSKIEKCIYDSCEKGQIDLFATATDDCTDDSELHWEYHVDLHNDGIVDDSDSGKGASIFIRKSYDLGEHNIRWVFEDMCGNKEVRTQFFDLMNCKGPNAYCKNGIIVDLIPMDLDGDGECDTEMVEIWAQDLDDNSSHPCDYDLTYSFGRDTSNKVIRFDCDDLGRREVEICVTDIKGFQSCCNTFVIVQDNNLEDCCPREFDKDCVVGPADVNLTDCTASIDPMDLMSFPVTTNCVIDSVITSYSDEDDTTGDNCQKITRTWTVELYLDGVDTVCTFVHCITIDNEFTEDSIVWPQDSLIFTDCEVSLDTADTGGVPRLLGEYCDYVTISYADVRQQDPDPACESYVRTWTVTNGCDNDREYTFEQFIRFLNQAPPIMMAPGDVTVNVTPGLCVAFVSLPPVTVGDCNSGVTVVNSYNPNGPDASGVFNVGETTIVFNATDECGNVSTAVTVVTVIDNIPPAITCPDNMTFDCDVDLDNINFGVINATDNCVDVTLEIDTTYELNECNIGTITRTATAIDNSGNTASCEQVITIENADPLVEADITWPMDSVMIAVCDSSSPEFTGEPLIDTSAVSCHAISVTYSDSTYMGLCGGDTCTILERTWTVTDTCQLDGMGSGIFVFVQIITIDGAALMVNCPADTTVSCVTGVGDLSQYGTFSATTDCGILSETLDTIYDLNSCDIGTVTRIYTVVDSTGMMISCQQTITVENANPFTEDNITWPADSVEVGGCDSMDMAGEPVIDTTGLDCFDITVSSSDSMYVDTCEGAPCDVVRRKWTVVDSCQLDGMGGGIYCDTQIIVILGDMLSVTCPADTLLDCEEVLGDLDDYGVLTFDSPCGVAEIIRDTVYNLNACSLGTVVRSLYVRDTIGNEVSCSQIITVGTDNPFDEDDIVWPADTVTLDNCSSSHPDSIMSRPSIDSTALTCARLSINYSDSTSSSCDQTPCLIIFRDWLIVDTCQLDGMGGGMFSFQQIIEVNDTTPPVFVGGDIDTTFYASRTNCEAEIESLIAVVEDCSPTITVTNNSPHADSSGEDAAGIYPLGITEFYFFAEDGCCNVDSVLARVEVLDTVPPRIVCTKVFRTMRDSIEGVKFFASDPIVSAFDNCTIEPDLKYSFDLNDMSDTCRFYNCDSLRMTGLPNLLYMETVYVWDESGNVDSCQALLQVVDESGCIASTLTYTVAGLISTEQLSEVADAQMNLSGSGQQVVMTNKYGQYSFGSMMPGGSYLVEPRKNDDHMNGVTTKDLVYIQRHLLGIEELSSAYQMIAADVNSSGNVSASDLVDLRRLLLGYYDEFPSNTSWRFVHNDYDFPDPKDPWLEEWPEVYEISQLDSNMSINFMGVKIGDVTGDVGFNGVNNTRSSEEMTLSVVHQNGYYHFFKTSEKVVRGFQLTLNWSVREDFDLVFLNDSPMADEDFGYHSIDRGVVTIACSEDLSEGEVYLFSIPEEVARVNSWYVDGSITPDVAYNESYEPMEIVFSQSSQSSGYALHQNKPNPFDRSTTIGFELPSKQEGTMTIWTMNGQMVYEATQVFDAGYNEILITNETLTGSGMYYYRLDCEGFSQIKKMINID